MTTKPKAKKFRIRRAAPVGNSGEAPGRGGAAAPKSGGAAAPKPEATGPGRSTAAGVAGGERPRVVQPGQAAQPAKPAQPAQPARPTGAAAQQPRTLNPLEEAALGPQEDGFPDGPMTSQAAAKAGAATGSVENAGEAGAEAEIAAIRQEGLTGRQLRMARRVAQKHGLPATSDFDAVRLLRRAGIDPFQRATMLELVSPEGGEGPGAKQVQLPQTVKPAPQNLPSTKVMDAAERAKSVMEIQLDIAKRRRRKTMLLLIRLAFFVFLPTVFAGYYYYNVATPMYATKSEFVIQNNDGVAGAGAGGFLQAAGLGSPDSIGVQGYLLSREAMLRLDADEGFKAHFQDPSIDPIQRLDPGASDEEAYKLYKRNVKIGYDPTEGILKMEVIATDPAISQRYSQILISYAEEKVDNLTQRLREDQMQGALDSFEEAEAKWLDALSEKERLQIERQVLDPTGEGSLLMGQISNLESLLLEQQLKEQRLKNNARPNQAQLSAVQDEIRILTDQIAELRQKVDELARIQGQLAEAETLVMTRAALMQQSLQQLEVARVEANKQTRYLETNVNPTPPDRPTYPRSFENTILAFLIFAGIYLMASLTASILREQVSA